MALSDNHGVRRHVYEALEGPEHIRLIALHPASSIDTPLQINFTSSTLEDLGGCYEAVSYTWGETMSTFALHVDDGTQVFVTGNLDRALRYLRRTDRDRLLWADAASINQADNDEKAVQIPLMVRIFRGARRVMAWLDPGRDTTIEQRGMRTMNHLSRVSKVKEEELHADFGEVLRFLNLPWFNRLWIVQEVVFSLEIRLICGETELPFSRFIAALSVIALHRPPSDHDGKARMDALKEIKELWIIHSLTCGATYNPPKNTNIEHLVDRFSSYGCSDPRDRIFALYSMATNVQPSGHISQTDDYLRRSSEDVVYMDIDYSLDVRETYKHFAFACLRSTGRRLARLIWNAVFSRLHSPQPVTWPSWVPDWRVAPKKTRIHSRPYSYLHINVAKLTANVLRLDVPVIRRFRDTSKEKLYTVKSKLSRKIHGSRVSFKSQMLQLLQLYRMLQTQKIVGRSRRRPGSRPRQLGAISFPSFLVKVIRKLVDVHDHEDFDYSDDEDSHDEDEDSDNKDSSNEDSGDKDSDDHNILPSGRIRRLINRSDDKIFRELEQYFARKATVPKEDGSQCSSTSSSSHFQPLIKRLDHNLGDATDLFCFHDPSTQVNSVGYGSAALEPGDHILPVGDVTDTSDIEDLVEVFILRKSCSIEESGEERSVYRLVGHGYIFDPTTVFLRSGHRRTGAKKEFFIGREFREFLVALGFWPSKQTLYLA